MTTLKGSVGLGGQNNPSDIRLVRQLLMKHKHWLHPRTIPINDKYDKALEEAITLFQKTACALLKPDGRVDPNGFTLKRLDEVYIHKPNHAIFNICPNPQQGISDQDYLNAAQQLNCEVEAIKAVAEVETKGDAWDQLGRPTILFEKHYFKDRTQAKFNKTHPDISGAAGGYGTFNNQYLKLYRAAVLDQSAALKSASWRKFQIMGDNYKTCGFTSVEAFVSAHMKSELEQLHSVVNFIKNNKYLLADIQNKNWAKFAERYNGRNYKKTSMTLNLLMRMQTLKLTKGHSI